MERDIKPLGHQLGEHLVVVPWAVARQGPRRVVPVAHEQPHKPYPCSLSRYAATEESTPPERPITTRFISDAKLRKFRKIDSVAKVTAKD